MSRRTDSDAPTITAAYPRLLLGLLEERGLAHTPSNACRIPGSSARSR
nr:hypothetical protein [Pseudomonas aeruginosa]